MNDYTVLGKADLWITVFVGDGQLGGVTVSASRPDGTTVLAPRVLQRAGDTGNYEENLGVALDFENAILLVVGAFAHATDQTQRASMTVELFQKLTKPNPGQESKRFFEAAFTQEGQIDNDTTSLDLEVVML